MSAFCYCNRISELGKLTFSKKVDFAYSQVCRLRGMEPEWNLIKKLKDDVITTRAHVGGEIIWKTGIQRTTEIPYFLLNGILEMTKGTLTRFSS